MSDGWRTIRRYLRKDVDSWSMRIEWSEGEDGTAEVEWSVDSVERHAHAEGSAPDIASAMTLCAMTAEHFDRLPATSTETVDTDAWF